MLKLGLSAQEQRAFEAGLLDDHEIQVRVDILDMNHKLLGTLTGKADDGQVDVDATQEVTRTCKVTMLDPGNRLALSTGDPNSAGMWAANQVRIHLLVRSQQLPRWVAVPVFCGPITEAKRTGELVHISGAGKEHLLMGAMGWHYHARKGTPKTKVLTDILEGAGETLMDIPARKDKTIEPFTVASKEQPWKRLQGMARALGSVRLWYDATGTCRLTNLQQQPIYTFRGGTGGNLLSEPELDTDLENLRNIVVVTGGVPKGAKDRVQKVAQPEAAHPFHAKNLGRNGKGRYIREDIEDDAITSEAAAQNLANDKLWEFLQATVEVKFESLVIPHLEPWDRVRVQTAEWAWETTAEKFSIPLTTKGTMTFGKHYTTRKVRGFRPKRAATVKPKTKTGKK